MCRFPRPCGMAVLASLAFLGFQAARNRLKDKDLAEDFPAAIQHDQTVAKHLQAARDAEANGLQALDRLHRKLDASP